MQTSNEIIPEAVYIAVKELAEKMDIKEPVTHDWIRSIHPQQRLRLMCLAQFGNQTFAEVLLQLIADCGFIVAVPNVKSDKPIIHTP